MCRVHSSRFDEAGSRSSHVNGIVASALEARKTFPQRACASKISGFSWSSKGATYITRERIAGDSVLSLESRSPTSFGRPIPKKDFKSIFQVLAHVLPLKLFEKNDLRSDDFH